jgi:steroid delta-isomerase
MPSNLSDAVAQLKLQFENVTISSVGELMNCYASNAIFKDPFQEVIGREQIQHIFLNMFKQLDQPSFIVRETLMGSRQVAFLWDFHFSMKRWNKAPLKFTGVSWLYFDDDFLVGKHHDYWDPAAGLYEHLPLIGPLMRGLKSLA